MSHPVRSFFALPLADAERSVMAETVRQLRDRPNGDRVRWVRPENLHVTLRFLGELRASELPDVVAAVESECRVVERFRCQLQAIRLFPSARHPKVLAVGLDAGGQLSELAAAIERGVRRAGLPATEQEFRAHLTLGRMKGHGYPSLQDDLHLDLLSLPVDAVVLYRSELEPDGPVYTELERLDLLVAKEGQAEQKL